MNVVLYLKIIMISNEGDQVEAYKMVETERK